MPPTAAVGKSQLEKDFHIAFPELEFTGHGPCLHDKSGRMYPDFSLPGTNKVIELYGNYWHRNDNPEVRIDRLRKIGYEAVIIWENDFRAHPQDICDQVRRFLYDTDLQ